MLAERRPRYRGQPPDYGDNLLAMAALLAGDEHTPSLRGKVDLIWRSIHRLTARPTTAPRSRYRPGAGAKAHGD